MLYNYNCTCVSYISVISIATIARPRLDAGYTSPARAPALRSPANSPPRRCKQTVSLTPASSERAGSATTVPEDAVARRLAGRQAPQRCEGDAPDWLQRWPGTPALCSGTSLLRAAATQTEVPRHGFRAALHSSTPYKTHLMHFCSLAVRIYIQKGYRKGNFSSSFFFFFFHLFFLHTSWPLPIATDGRRLFYLFFFLFFLRFIFSSSSLHRRPRCYHLC